MNKLIFEGIRCFNDYHCSQLKPMTLLVGENSTGKSTFLALARIAWDVTEGDLGEDIFNEEPFLLGSYEQIASYLGGRAGRAKSFSVGMEISRRLPYKSNTIFSDKATVIAKFIAAGSEPKLDEWRFDCGKFSIFAKPSRTVSSDRSLTITTPAGSQEIAFPPYRGWLSLRRVLADIRYMLRGGPNIDANRKGRGLLKEMEANELQTLAYSVSNGLGNRPYAFAPIRTRPQRTYDPLKEVPKPEGSHVPMVLAKYLQEKLDGKSSLRDSLTSFGKTSGLFNSLDVKRKGNKESDPFQIVVKTFGQTFNLVDVGYGISQVLPIIVDVLQNKKEGTFLLQQPEVHLHPQAQAELGSFLLSLVKERKQRFIIETHSDYLIDRIRMDVRDKKIPAEDVLILYFEKSHGGVDVHEIKLDEMGNIIKAPPTYRQFFLQEERRMLGV